MKAIEKKSVQMEEKEEADDGAEEDDERYAFMGLVTHT